jgi:hypothetical protein
MVGNETVQLAELLRKLSDPCMEISKKNLPKDLKSDTLLVGKFW